MTCKPILRVADALLFSTQRTFCDMAFIDVVEPTETVTGLDIRQVLHIAFSHPIRGQMILGLPLACKQSVVENIFGRDWNELSAAQIDDCLLEVLNVLAGHFLHDYCGEEGEHVLSLPALFFDVGELRRNLSFCDHYYDAEGCLFQVSLRLEPVGPHTAHATSRGELIG